MNCGVKTQARVLQALLMVNRSAMAMAMAMAVAAARATDGEKNHVHLPPL